MKIALSTNWCNLRIESGREIAELAKDLGFEALELGFNTTAEQAKEIAGCGLLPVGSIHAFCPVPISAPHGYPELYQLASFDESARAIARVHVKKNVAFAASVGADAVVLHAGREWRGGLKFFAKRRSRKLVEIFLRELDLIRPELEKHRVTLGLENMPYREGFPDESEIAAVAGDWVRPWFDTGHWFARGAFDLGFLNAGLDPFGCHVNDSNGGDDHLPPGEGKIDFSALAPVFVRARHVVFEPNQDVSEERLAAGLEHFKRLLPGG